MGEFDLRNIEQNTSAVTFEGRKTDHPQIGVNLGAVINDLQCFTVKNRPLIAPQPLGVHVGKQAAEGAADQPLQWYLFQLCQRGITVSEDSVHRAALLVEYHLDIREGNGQNIEAAVMRVVFFLCCGDIVPAEAADHVLLFDMKLGNDLFFLPHHIVQGLTVAEVDFVGNAVYRHDRYKAAAVYL